ncbi:aminoglycoside phosphotransferase family protein [Flavobacteriales bacterium]|nr:aminoglycoside phosphotransferase family protein [Flavobacteriales bacterium]
MELKFAESILLGFGLKESIVTIKKVESGLINSTFVLNSSNNSYILQAINTNIFPNYEKGLENILTAGNWLKRKNYPYSFPLPIKGRYLKVENEVWRLMPYVKNSISYNRVSSLNQVKSAASCLGEFYHYLSDFKTESLSITLPNFHHGNWIIKKFDEALLNADKERLLLTKSLISEVEKEFPILKKWDEVCNSLPERVVHYDTKINNFLFDKKTDEVLALIDLDTIMPGCVLSDIGDMIRTYSNPVGEESKEIEKVVCNMEIIRTIIEEFTKKITLRKEEIESLFFGGMAITLMQCVRFLTDYLNGDSYYKTNYKDQNLVRAKNQWALYKSLKES